MTNKIIGIGNAIVDFLAKTEDNFLQKFEVEKVVPIEEWKKLGFILAKEILNNGGAELMKNIKEALKK